MSEPPEPAGQGESNSSCVHHDDEMFQRERGEGDPKRTWNDAAFRTVVYRNTGNASVEEIAPYYQAESVRASYTRLGNSFYDLSAMSAIVFESRTGLCRLYYFQREFHHTLTRAQSAELAKLLGVSN